MIVSTEWLQEHLEDQHLAIVDVRHVTNMPGAGQTMYVEGHIPRAVFLDVDTDLADRSDLTRGRHPLPHPKKFVEALTRVGIGKWMKIVAYDNSAGSTAARLWWMMHWIGVNDVAVLDGGITKWMAEGRPLETGGGKHKRIVQPLDPESNDTMIVNKDSVRRARELELLLVDVRSAERYRGEREPFDTKAGHIPGAVNVPWEQNVTSGPVPVFKSVMELQVLYGEAGVRDPSKTVSYCGSGVTACMGILAMEMAGLRGVRLYPGSWSEWIAGY